jgi:hypothetical protein
MSLGIDSPISQLAERVKSTPSAQLVEALQLLVLKGVRVEVDIDGFIISDDHKDVVVEILGNELKRRNIYWFI